MDTSTNSYLARIEPVGPKHAHDAGLSPFMDYHVFCQLADALPELSELRLHGRGEPLSHLHLFDMVRHAVGRGLLVSLTTGLGVLSEQQAEECVTSGLYRIRIVADAAALRQAADAFADASTRPRFFRILRNLRRLIAARTRLQQLRPEVSLLAIIEQRDLPQMAQLVRFARDEGIEKLAVEIADGRGFPTSALAARRWFREAESLARQTGVSLEPPRFLRDRRTGASGRQSFIAFNGEIVHAAPVMPVARAPFEPGAAAPPREPDTMVVNGLAAGSVN